MHKLLRANFVRLWKSKLFWIGMAFMAVLAGFAVNTRYWENEQFPETAYSIEGVLFTGCMFMPVVASVFIGIFIGTEYSDGTIRNKLIVGHARSEVYFSNLIVCTVGILLMHLIYIAVIVCIGFPLIGKKQMQVSDWLPFFLCSLVTVVALTALFLLISMLVQRKSSGAVIAIILSIVLLCGAMIISQKLNAPEYYNAVEVEYVETDTNDITTMQSADQVKNPSYLMGTKRKVYEFLYDFVPSCQMVQIAQQSADNLKMFPLYSLAIIVVSTSCGILLFHKKDLK